jgi:hypothetical protein
MPKRKIKNQGSSTTQRRARPKCTTVDELGRMLMYAEGKDTPKDAIEAHKFKFEGWKSFAKAAIDELGLRDGADTQISKTYYNVWSRHADPQVVIDARAAAAATAATKPKQSDHAEHMARTRKKQRSLHEGGASAEAMRMTAGQSGNTLLASLGIEIAAAGRTTRANIASYLLTHSYKLLSTLLLHRMQAEVEDFLLRAGFVASMPGTSEFCPRKDTPQVVHCDDGRISTRGKSLPIFSHCEISTVRTVQYVSTYLSRYTYVTKYGRI